jgi:hypothetical protein
MTLRRPPLTPSEALARIAGFLPGGYPEMAEVAGRSQSQVYAWGNPSTDDDIPLGCARRLDLHYRAMGGDGYPLLETYAAQLEFEGGQRFAREVELGRHLIAVLKETGEAKVAIAEAAQPGADDLARRKAAAEVRDAISVLTRALPMLGASHVAPTPDEAAATIGERHQTGPPG